MVKIGGDSFHHTHKQTHTPSHPSLGRVNKGDSEQHILNSIFFLNAKIVSNILCVPTLTILLAERLFFVVAAAILVVFNSMALF